MVAISERSLADCARGSQSALMSLLVQNGHIESTISISTVEKFIVIQHEVRANSHLFTNKHQHARNEKEKRDGKSRR